MYVCVCVYIYIYIYTYIHIYTYMHIYIYNFLASVCEVHKIRVDTSQWESTLYSFKMAKQSV